MNLSACILVHLSMSEYNCYNLYNLQSVLFSPLSSYTGKCERKRKENKGNHTNCPSPLILSPISKSYSDVLAIGVVSRFLSRESASYFYTWTELSAVKYPKK
jgi:hypothetical protein